MATPFESINQLNQVHPRSPGDSPPGAELRPVSPPSFDFRIPPQQAPPEPPLQPDRTCREDPDATVSYNSQFGLEKAGKGYGAATQIYRAHLIATAEQPWNPWAPFSNAYDFSLARWMLKADVSRQNMQVFLESGLDRFGSPNLHNADTIRTAFEDLLWSQIDGPDVIHETTWRRFNVPLPEWVTSRMAASTGRRSARNSSRRSHGRSRLSDSEDEPYIATVYYRDVIKSIQLLLGHLPFAEHLDFEPVKLYDGDGNRVYNEISSGAWWWETQSKIPDGGLLIPVLLASDKTHLTNYSGDKSGWPLYLSIGNIRKDIRRKPNNNAWILIGLLPIPPKGCGREISDEIFHRSIERILSPLAALDVAGSGTEFHCADGFLRRGYPILSAWVADYPEYRTITGCVNMRCPVCEIPAREMGHTNFKSRRDYDPTNPQYDRQTYPCRDEETYEGLIAQNLHGKEATQAWGALGMRRNFKNPLWKMPLCNVFSLWQPDELHVLFLGIVKTMIGDWIIPFCAARNFEKRFHRRFKRVPRYPQLKRFRRTFHEVQSGSWQGKEMRMMARFILIVIAPIFGSEAKSFRGQLRRRLSSEKAQELRRKLDSLTSATRTIRALSEIVLLIGQRSHTRGQMPAGGRHNVHTWGSLEYLDAAIETFHAHKSVFVENIQSAEKGKVKKRIFEELEIEHSRRYGLEIGTWRTVRDRQAAEKEAVTASALFAGPKIHLTLHMTDAIERMGSADNFTTDISELLHKHLLKPGYRTSNKKDFEKQILWYNDRITALSYMEQNLRHLAQAGYFVAETAFLLDMLRPEARKTHTRSHSLRRAATASTGRMNETTGLQVDYSSRWPYLDPDIDVTPAPPPVTSVNNLPKPALFGEVRGAIGNRSLTQVEELLGWAGFTKLFHEFLRQEWGEDTFQTVFSALTLADFGRTVYVRLYNAVKCYTFDFHPPHEVRHDILRCEALHRRENTSRESAQCLWVDNLVNAEDVETFHGKRVCFPHLYFAYKAPPHVERFAIHEGAGGPKFNCLPSWSAALNRYRYAPQDMGFAYLNVGSYSSRDSIPDDVDGMVRITRRRGADAIVRVRDIERAAHAMLVDENTSDIRTAEYLVNNLVDGYHYWTFY